MSKLNLCYANKKEAAGCFQRPIFSFYKEAIKLLAVSSVPATFGNTPGNANIKHTHALLHTHSLSLVGRRDS